jgi:hypothetical protein
MHAASFPQLKLKEATHFSSVNASNIYNVLIIHGLELLKLIPKS